MRIDFNVKGAARKELVKALSVALDAESKYLGAPTMAYKVGDVTVTRDGALEWDEMDYPMGLDQVMQDLERSGFESIEDQEENSEEAIEELEDANRELETEDAEDAGYETPSEDAEREFSTEVANRESDEFSVSMPRGFYTDEALENLQKIIDSKASLIKKAFKAKELPIEIDDDHVTFNWFHTVDAEEAKAYGNFISRLSIMAKNAKRVTAKDKDVGSEKYAFRCFLLRLGFTGNEYKADRKILLKNLKGSAAFPTAEAAETFLLKQRGKKVEQKTE